MIIFAIERARRHDADFFKALGQRAFFYQARQVTRLYLLILICWVNGCYGGHFIRSIRLSSLRRLPETVTREPGRTTDQPVRCLTESFAASPSSAESYHWCDCKRASRLLW